MKKILALVLAAGCLATSCSKKIQQEANYQVIPLPQEIIVDESAPGFLLSDATVISYPAENDTLRRNAELLAEYLKTLTGNTLQITDQAPESNVIRLTDGLTNENTEAYRNVTF